MGWAAQARRRRGLPPRRARATSERAAERAAHVRAVLRGRGEDAVSPVIGVILMVAVTVVLAAVVFLMVNPVDEGEQSPTLSFRRDEGQDQIELVRGANGNWGDIRLFVSGGVHPGLRYELNAEAGAASPEVGAGVVMPTADLRGGDFVSFCADGGADDLSVGLTHIDSSTYLYEGTFLRIRPCL